MRHLIISLIIGMLSGPALADEPFPEAGSVSISSFGANGTGCPEGSVAANISPDNRALTLLFDSYVIDSTETESFINQKNCLINMSLKAPAGWRYALFSIDYRGFADLSQGASAHQETEYAFGISGQKRIGAMDLNGPVSIDYHERQTGSISELAWSDCGNGGGPDVLSITTIASVNTKPAPNEINQHLASSRSRYAEAILGGKILSMVVVTKHSAAQCRENFSYGFSDSKAWVKHGCRADFKFTVDLPQQTTERPIGLLTIDSIDAQLYSGQEYGVAWQRCGEGRWIQSVGVQNCQQTCKGKGLKMSRDSFGAECTSGEARPNSAAGQVQFTHGCWGGCAAQGNIKTDALGPFCYQPGQKKDADKSDRIVGCFCK